jgi:hypothetical protein
MATFVSGLALLTNWGRVDRYILGIYSGTRFLFFPSSSLQHFISASLVFLLS